MPIASLEELRKISLEGFNLLMIDLVASGYHGPQLSELTHIKERSKFGFWTRISPNRAIAADIKNP